MYVLTASQMQSIDEYTIEQLGISQEILMEKAALCSVAEIKKMNPGHVLIVCGSGNNGGDGIAVARILLMQGIHATVYLCFDPSCCKESIRNQLAVYQKIGGKTVTEIDFGKYDIIVDAIFGIGLSRVIQAPFDEVIMAMNTAREKSGVRIVSLDIPSGIHTDNGRIMGTAVKADKTVTFSYAKRGHLLYPGKEYTGECIIADAGMYIDFSPLNKDTVGFSYFNREECLRHPLPQTAHKGTAGRILIIAGSKDMCGACYLSSCASFRMGCGLVDIYTVQENLEAMKTMLPEAILHNRTADTDFSELKQLMEMADCVVLGPGLSTSDEAKRCVSFALEHCTRKMIIDADAVNCIAQNPRMLYNHTKMTDAPVVLTPHPKELSRLISRSVSELLEDYPNLLVETAKEFGVVLVGKGAASIVTDGERFYINQSGNEGLATAGSGDVLAGMIAAIAVREASLFEAACKGVYLHGLCGDDCADRIGKTSVMAHDLLDGIIYLNKAE